MCSVVYMLVAEDAELGKRVAELKEVLEAGYGSNAPTALVRNFQCSFAVDAAADAA